MGTVLVGLAAVLTPDKSAAASNAMLGNAIIVAAQVKERTLDDTNPLPPPPPPPPPPRRTALHSS